MQYVMMPVPEEHADEFNTELLRITLRQRLSEWDEPSLRVVLNESPPKGQALIEVLARASADARRLTRQQTADALGLEPEDLVAVTDEINGRCLDLGLPFLVMVAPGESDTMGELGEHLVIVQVASRMLVPMLDAPSDE